MCLASGKIATEACTNDIRLDAPQNPLDFIATSEAVVYPEDMPTEYCNKHVLVDYCSGGGVATEWCKKFASVDSSVKLRKEGLVKMTQSEINRILRAAPYRLISDYTRNDYVYYINANGTDGVFKGFYNNLKQSVDAPYVVCKVHTQKAWQQYEAQHPTTPPATPAIPVAVG